MSLIEQKKRQWAKEREEMSKLSEMFESTTRKVERTSMRTYYSNMDLTSSQMNFGSSSRKKYYFDETIDQRRTDQFFDTGYYNQHHEINENADAQQYVRGVRSPSLPPIGRNNSRPKQTPMMSQQERIHIHTDEDTSGYLSDGRCSPNAWKSRSERSRPRMRLPNENRSENMSSTSYIAEKSGRMFEMENGITDAKIGDRSGRSTTYATNNKYLNQNDVDGMQRAMLQQTGLKPDDNRNGQGRKIASSYTVDDNEHETDFSSIPKTPSSISSDGSRDYSHVSPMYQSINFRKDKEERAKWADRNTPSTQFYDAVAKDSAVKSGPCWLERGFADSGNESVRSYSFIRGQNIPIDANTLAERTTKRLKAIEFQNAIKEQLIEREAIKRLEHERMMLEERRQEDRARKQMEDEQLRVEAEQRKQQNKIEAEMKIQKAMKIAIEKARQEAELDKARRRRELHVTSNERNGDVVNGNDAPTCEDVLTSNVGNDDNAAAAASSPKMETNECVAVDDDEKILIGTPIKMKKKSIALLNLAPNSNAERAESPTIAPQANQTKTARADARNAVADETNADGIALVLQALPPIVPILGKSDLLNLNQNLSNLNNIQLAVMLAHQVQQLNTTMSQTFPKQSNDAATNGHSNAVTDTAECVRCNICGKRQKSKSIGSGVTEIEQMETTKKDVATVTEDIDDSSVSANPVKHIDVGTETETDPEPEIEDELAATVHQFSMTPAPSTASITSQSHSNDASTQTDDKKSVFECCSQCRYHKHHHHHVLVDEVGPPEPNEDPKDHGKSTAPTNETKAIEFKELKEIQRLEDRPKWGVNRPQVQYVKASERDPNYVRNRKKCHKKRLSRLNQDAREAFVAVSRSNSPTLSTMTNDTVTLSKSPKRESEMKLKKAIATPSSSKRNICTEILPIKTDMNGRVYLNFREASVVMSEDEIRQNLRNRCNKMERIINRGRTIDDTFATHNGTDSPSSGGNDKETSRRTQCSRSDVIVDIS